MLFSKINLKVLLHRTISNTVCVDSHQNAALNNSHDRNERIEMVLQDDLIQLTDCVTVDIIIIYYSTL